jgi:hypothetical protein
MATVTHLHLRPVKGPRAPRTARTQDTKTVASVALVRSGAGWRVDGTHCELTYDETQRLWFVDVPTGAWFYARSLRRGVEALKTKGFAPTPKGAA